MARCLSVVAALAVSDAALAEREQTAAPEGHAPFGSSKLSTSEAGAPSARPDKVEVIVVKVGTNGSDADRPILAGGGQPFRDCSDSEVCPDMVVVPSSPLGTLIGSPDGELGRNDNEALHSVTISAFAIGRYEVSVAEYKACVASGACRPPEWLEPGGQHNVETGASSYYKNYGAAVTGSRQPVVGVSLNDATAYVAWLAKTTGKPYRLLSEAEWEYAARAGASTAYWWGDAVKPDGHVRAACRGCGSEWDGKSFAPVDAFAPNPWGLYNVHGNVWEWVADFYCGAYDTGPINGSARLADDCAQKDANGLHVLRGGSSFYEERFARSASRLRNYADFRNVSVGFRVARTLD